MAGEVHDYKRQVAPAGDAGLILRKDPIGPAVGRAAAALASETNRWQEKMTREEAEADITKEQVTSSKSWEMAKLEMSKMQDPDEIKEFYGYWQSGERDRTAEVKTNRLGRRAIQMQSKVRNAKYEAEALGAGGLVDVAYIRKNEATWESQRQDALLGLFGDRFENAEVAYNYAVDKSVGLGTMKEADGVKLKASYLKDSNYRLTYGKVLAINESWKRGTISDNADYVNQLESVRDELPEIALDIGQRSYIENMLTAQISNGVAKDRRQKQTQLNSMMEKSANGSIKAGDVLEFFQLNPGDVKVLGDYMQAGAQSYIASHPGEGESEKALNAITEVIAGNMTPGDAASVIAGADTKIAPAALVMLAATLYDPASGADDLLLHKSWFKGDIRYNAPPKDDGGGFIPGRDAKKDAAFALNQDAYMSKVMTRMSGYIAAMGSDDAWIDTTFRAAYSWRQQNPGATAEQEQAEIDKLFKGKANAMIRASYKPPISTAEDISDYDYVDDFLKGTIRGQNGN
jgi:hypothetical protein